VTSPSGSKNLAVSLENVSVRYRAKLETRPTMKSALLRLGRPQQEIRYIDALKDISFEVEHGEFLGIIGHNGAGKSTLLRTIAGILHPSAGRVTVNGYVTTLLSVGIGFNAELTGRENIKLGGLANGLTPKEILLKEDEIAEFSDLGEFIDYPMKTYSSGMYSRLGFAVAVHMDPDILLIDEALSAGDASFRDKAGNKIKEMMRSASAIILVSHGLATVEDMASDCIWLDHGVVKARGVPGDVIKQYTDFVQTGRSAIVMDEQ